MLKRIYLRSALFMIMLFCEMHCSSAQAVDTRKKMLTLHDAQLMALADHPAVAEQKFDALAAEEAIKIARSAYEPQVYGAAIQAFAPPGTRLSAYGGLNDPTIIQRTALGVGISQCIMDFGRTADLVKASEFAFKAREDRVESTRDIVLLQVTHAYFEVLRAKALLVVAQKTRSNREALLSQVTVLQRSGLRSTLDVSVAEGDVHEADQLVLEVRGRLGDAVAVLSEAMGSATLQTQDLQDIQALQPLPTHSDDFIATALHENPDLLSLEMEERAARKREDAAERLGKPSVNGYGFVGVTPFRAANQSIASSYAAAGISLTVPVFTGGALAAEKRKAVDERLFASAHVDAERNKLLRDVRVAFEGLKTMYGNIGVSAQVLKTAQQTLELMRARYGIGLNSIVDLSRAQLSETQAVISHTNATYDYILQRAALDFATGMLVRGI